MLKLVINNVHDLSKVMIVQTKPHHLRELAENLRTEDKEEVLAFHSPNAALWRSYKRSVMNKTAIIDGKVAACWGVAGKLFSDEGQPWLLTSPVVYEVSAYEFIKIYKNEVDRMLELFSNLTNYVAPDYKAAIKLLKMVGFTVEEPEIINNVLMCKFNRSI